MIIIGYQGIGKSTLANAENKCIDLESGNFWVDGQRARDWYKPYCQIANHLSEQGYTVFVSSHEVVRRELTYSKQSVFVVYPSVELKHQWIEKLKNRYFTTKLDKDYKALMNAIEMYEENIHELSSSPFTSYEIEDANYNLKDIVMTLSKFAKGEDI